MREERRVFALKPDVRSRMVGGQAVLIQQEKGTVLAVNEVGARVLELIDGVTSDQEIVKALKAEYEADPEQLEQEVGDFLQQLHGLGVIERPHVPGGGG